MWLLFCTIASVPQRAKCGLAWVACQVAGLVLGTDRVLLVCHDVVVVHFRLLRTYGFVGP